MKNISFTLLLVMTFMAFSSKAQLFTGGFSAGLSATQVDGDTHKGYNKAGIVAGGWVSLNYNDRSSIHVGMNYIMKGSKHNPDPEKGDYTYLLIRLGYVEMPILYQYRMKNGFFVEVGPSLGVLLHSYTEASDGSTIGPANNSFRLLDVSFQAGVGYRFSDKIRLALCNGNSLASIRKDRVTGDQRRIFGYGQYNNVMALELSYAL